MGTCLKRIPFLPHQLVGWLLWGFMLWLYMDKVVPGAFRGAGDWGIMMGIHVVTANLTAFAVGPRMISYIQHQRYIRAALLAMLLLIGVLVFALVLSMALSAITVQSYGNQPTTDGIVNQW